VSAGRRAGLIIARHVHTQRQRQHILLRAPASLLARRRIVDPKSAAGEVGQGRTCARGVNAGPATAAAQQSFRHDLDVLAFCRRPPGRGLRALPVDPLLLELAVQLLQARPTKLSWAWAGTKMLQMLSMSSEATFSSLISRDADRASVDDSGSNDNNNTFTLSEDCSERPGNQ